MRKTGKKQEREQSAAGQLRFPFHGLARQALWDTVVLSGFGFVQDELEAERSALCGERYAHPEHRQVVRAGHVPKWKVEGGAASLQECKDTQALLSSRATKEGRASDVEAVKDARCVSQEDPRLEAK